MGLSALKKLSLPLERSDCLVGRSGWNEVTVHQKPTSRQLYYQMSLQLSVNLFSNALASVMYWKPVHQPVGQGDKPINEHYGLGILCVSYTFQFYSNSQPTSTLYKMIVLVGLERRLL